MHVLLALDFAIVLLIPSDPNSWTLSAPLFVPLVASLCAFLQVFQLRGLCASLVVSPSLVSRR